MSFQDNGEKILRELGLTQSQARAYIVLLRLNACSTARAVSDLSHIARQDVYHTIAELQQVGLIERVIGNPVLFRAISMQEAVSILMERRQQKTNALIAEAKDLLESFSIEETKEQNQLENRQFTLIPRREMVVNRLERATENAQEQICVLTSWREFTQWICRLPEVWVRVVRRKVSVRWIIGKPEGTSSCFETLKELLGYPNFKLGIVPKPPKNRFGLFDATEAVIATLKGTNAAESPALWTNNSSVIEILGEYFDMQWKLTTPYKTPANPSKQT